jgi:hypothetical protein
MCPSNLQDKALVEKQDISVKEEEELGVYKAENL